MDRVRAAIIGLGNIFEGWGGGSGHLPGYAWAVDEAQVVALCDVNPAALERGRSALQRVYAQKASELEDAGHASLARLLREDAEAVRGYTTLDELLEREHPDLADILAPCERHEEIARRCLDAGCHVMCEKPLAPTWLAAERIARAAQDADRFFQYAEHLVFGDPFAALRGLVVKGEIGELECLWLSMTTGGPGAASYAKGGVGALLDMGSHAVVVAWFLAGFDYAPTRVRSRGPVGICTRIPQRVVDGELVRFEVDDHAHFEVLFEHPETGAWVTAYIEVGWCGRDSFDTVLVGTQGKLRPQGEQEVAVEDPYGRVRTVPIFHPAWLRTPKPPARNGFAQEIRAAVRSVRNNIRPWLHEQIAAESMAILNAAQLSERRGRRSVSLEEFKGWAKDFENRYGAGADEAIQRELSACRAR